MKFEKKIRKVYIFVFILNLMNTLVYKIQRIIIQAKDGLLCPASNGKTQFTVVHDCQHKMFKMCYTTKSKSIYQTILSQIEANCTPQQRLRPLF